jgi:Ca2+-binding RTX toxin-like protein
MSYTNLLETRKWDITEITYTMSSTFSTLLDTVNSEGFVIRSGFFPNVTGDANESLVLNALHSWLDLTNLTFKAADNVADANIGIFRAYHNVNSLLVEVEATTCKNGFTGNFTQNFIVIAKDAPNITPWDSTYIHEMGHALGLQGDGGLPEGYTVEYTIMGYETASGPDSLSFAHSPMALDILAIQALYGKTNAYHAGNTTYYTSSSEVNITESSTGILSSTTIWDSGGIDVIDAHDANFGVKLNLSAPVLGGALNTNIVDGKKFFVGYGADIENAIGSQYNDTITGNDAYDAATDAMLAGHAAYIGHSFNGANRLEGRGGDDWLYGLSGNDTLIGGVYGNTHEDSHNDNNTGSDNDVDIGLFAFAVASSDAGQVPVDGNDWLDGGAGDDWLDGGAGDDSLTGGAGKDVFSFQKDEHSTDRIMDFVSGEDKINLSQFDEVGGIGDVGVRKTTTQTKSFYFVSESAIY